MDNVLVLCNWQVKTRHCTRCIDPVNAELVSTVRSFCTHMLQLASGSVRDLPVIPSFIYLAKQEIQVFILLLNAFFCVFLLLPTICECMDKIGVVHTHWNLRSCIGNGYIQISHMLIILKALNFSRWHQFLTIW